MNPREHIEPSFLACIDEQEELGGIDTTKLNVGDKIEVQTKNSLYILEVKDPLTSLVKITQPKLFTEPTEVTFLGSSWGGGAIKVHWIGYGLNLEFTTKSTHFITTSICAAKVKGSNWEYVMEWENKNGEDEKA